MKFIIQTKDGQIIHEFSFALLESIKYQKWLGNDTIEVLLSDSIWSYNGILYPGYIPIGSVDFVTEYLMRYYDKEPKPINIPKQLLDIKWTNRVVFNGTDKDIVGFKFVKSNDKIKSFAGICSESPMYIVRPDVAGNYQISDVMDINSEWRAFVYKNNLVGLQNYSGQFDLFPDVNKIREMIEVYTESPIAYTLDVAIHGDNYTTSIVEVHDFFSCGLYGFNDYRILPYMHERWFNEFITKRN